MSRIVLKAACHVAVWVVAAGFAYLPSNFAVTSQDQAEVTHNARHLKPVVYTNKDFGFRFTLPRSWKGYTIKISEWEGGDGSSYQSHEDVPPPQTGPLISIGHPDSTADRPRQNIPIMVFTKAQWQLVEESKLIVSSAPIGPSELGRNKRYVFALPARYNYALLDGLEEVDKIIQKQALKAF